jgi:NTP pyrophosphatase (non-canonical NTP hydrolase)
MRAALTRIVVDWGVRAFARTCANYRVRALRLAEEVVEMAQALDVPEEQLADLVRVVYARPRGEAFQEVGGVQVRLVVLCAALGIDPDEALEAEVRRVLSKSPEHFAERNKQKIDLGLTG